MVDMKASIGHMVIYISDQIHSGEPDICMFSSTASDPIPDHVTISPLQETIYRPHGPQVQTM